MNFSVYSLSLSRYYKENAKNLISKDLHVAKKEIFLSFSNEMKIVIFVCFYLNGRLVCFDNVML